MKLTTSNALVATFFNDNDKGEEMKEPSINEKTTSFHSNTSTNSSQVLSKNEPKKEPEISKEDKITFWNCLNDVHYGTFQPDKLEKLNTWLIGSDGKWLVQNNEVGYFGVKKSEEGIETLPKMELDDAFIHLEYGKIPQSILDQIIAFFKGVMRKHSNSEAFCQVYYDKTEQKHIIHVPDQRVSGASVKYDKTKDLNRVDPERYVFVYECHSHNNMGAFWSGTDNADESDLRVFGVFGKLGKDVWEHKHRTFVGEEEIELSLESTFDIVKEEPVYKVAISDQESVTVKRDDIAVDETPRFMVQVGEKVHTVAKEAIKKVIKPEPTFPQEWMGAVNVRPVSTQFQSTRHGGGYYSRPQFGGSGSFSKSPFIPGSNAQTTTEASETSEERQVSMGLSEETGMEEAVDTLCDYTMNFSDPGMTSCLMQIMEDKDCLTEFKNSALAFTGEWMESNHEPDESYIDQGYLW